MTDEALLLFSEIKELETLLASIPADALIERMSLEARLENARKALATAPVLTSQKAKLTFQGKPVIASHGIAADFGARAAGAFSDAFAAIAAALTDRLQEMGPIPNREKNQLLITGTAVGSFGFEFELPMEEPSLLPEAREAQQAIKTIESLFRLAAAGSDDEVAEVIEEVHPRAVKKVHEFLELLVQQQAWCALEFGDRSFRFTDYEQIKTSNERLRDENIQERKESYTGELQGVLPESRSFEFKLSTRPEVIKGKVDKTIGDPGILNREWLHKPITMDLQVIQVGQGRPRFTLMSLDDLKP